MTNDFRALCAELLAWAEHTSSHYYKQPDVLDRARALLAQPVAEGPTDEELMELMPQQMRDDLAAAALALAEVAGTDSRRAMGVMRIILNRHAVDHARAVLARWGRPTPPPLTPASTLVSTPSITPNRNDRNTPNHPTA